MKERATGMSLLLATVVPAQTGWVESNLRPEPRAYLALAHDTARARLVLFGGTDAARVFGDTWECAGHRWLRRSLPASPPARSSHAMVYDAARGRIVLFGGSPASSQHLADTWEFDGSAWIQRAPATSPPSRAGHAMVYDAARQRVVLFGGNAGPTKLFSDTWEWEGTTWTQRFPVAAPSARYYHGMAFDSSRGRSVLFGGVIPTTFFGDTWEWDGSNWTKASPTTSPSPRWEHAMAYDAVRRRVVSIGGVPYVDYRIWEFDGATWTPRVDGNPHPYADSASAVAYDSLRGKIAFFGGRPASGYTGDSMEWDGSAWSDLGGPTAYLVKPSIAFDSARGVCVYVGGYYNAASETWEWDGIEWVRRSPTTGPPANDCVLAFDSRRGRTVSCGSQGPNPMPTWEWDGSQWLQMTAGVAPPNRSQHALAYDPIRGRIVLFGGGPAASASYFADTWEWDGTQWQQAFPATSPPARRSHAMAFDGVRGRVILFGGEVSGNLLGDFWEWDGVTWTQLSPPSLPPPRQYFGMAFDSARGRTVLSGSSRSANTDETWEWDGTNWSRRFPSASPSTGPSASPALAYDSSRGRVVLFGTRATTPLASGIWEYAADRPAQSLAYGAGCAGAGGTPSLAPSGDSLPWIGFTFDARLSGLGSNAATNVPFLVLGDSKTAWGSIVLPTPLAQSGMPGCTLYTNILATLPLTNVSGSAPCSIGIPNVPALAGRSVQAQGWVTSPGANPLGVVVSNACEWTLGEK